MSESTGKASREGSEESLLTRAGENLKDGEFLLALLFGFGVLLLAALGGKLVGSAVMPSSAVQPSLIRDLLTGLLGWIPDWGTGLERLILQVEQGVEVAFSGMGAGRIHFVLPLTLIWFLLAFRWLKPEVLAELKRAIWLMPAVAVAAVLPGFGLATWTGYLYLLAGLALTAPFFLRPRELRRAYAAASPALLYLLPVILGHRAFHWLPVQFGTSPGEITPLGAVAVWTPAVLGMALWCLTADTDREERAVPGEAVERELEAGLFDLRGVIERVWRGVRSPEVRRLMLMSFGCALLGLIALNAVIALGVASGLPAGLSRSGSGLGEIVLALQGAGYSGGLGLHLIIAAAGSAAALLLANGNDLSDHFEPLAWAVLGLAVIGWITMAVGSQVVQALFTMAFGSGSFGIYIVSSALLAVAACWIVLRNGQGGLARRLLLALLVALPFQFLGQLWTAHAGGYMDFGAGAAATQTLTATLPLFLLLAGATLAGYTAAVWTFLLAAEDPPVEAATGDSGEAAAEGPLLDSA